MLNLHHLLTHLYYVSEACPGRERSEIPANYANSMLFAHILHELRKFHTVRPHAPRIMQNSHHLLTHCIVCFRCLASGRELPKITVNQVKFAQFAHGSHELRRFHKFCTKFDPYLVHWFWISDLRRRAPEN